MSEEVAPEVMAVAVAKDVLKWLNQLHLVPGVYLCIKAGPGYVEGTDLQTVADELTDNCEVCLLGACLLSQARLFDDIKTVCHGKGPFGYRTVYEKLRNVFSSRTIGLMESAFEGTKMDRQLSEEDFLAALRFRRDAVATPGADRSDLDRALVRRVMENVIRNGGEFVPAQGVDA